MANTRNRIIYNVEALFVGPVGPHSATGAHFFVSNNPSAHLGSADITGVATYDAAVAAGATTILNSVRQLHRVQEVSHSAEVTKTDINELGRLAAVSRKVIEPPTVSMDASYYLTDGSNESKIGLYVAHPGAPTQLSAIKNILDNTENEKNYFILTAEDNSDADRQGAAGEASFNDNRVDHWVAGIGNGFLSNYNVEVSVGAVPQASFTIDASNVAYVSGSSGNYIPAINTTNGAQITAYEYMIPVPTGVDEIDMIDAIRPGDVSLEWGSDPLPWGGGDITSLNVQSFSVDVPLAREPLNRIGSNFPFARETSFPITITASVTADVVEFATGSLVDMFCKSDSRDIALVMKQSCSETPVLRYELKDVSLDSQSFSSSIGPNKSVDLSFSTQIGAAEDLNKGLFISGSNHYSEVEW